jgi:DNA-directed RNA polymerase subunit RPC12/RpoP
MSDKKVPVIHAHWIYDHGNEYIERYHCSHCGSRKTISIELEVEELPKECRKCGAKMDEK